MGGVDAKADTHKKILEAHRSNPSVFAREHGLYWLKYCETAIKDYQDIADANRQLAEMHRKMAADIK